MAGIVNTKLKELGIALPEAAVPAANYVPARRSGNLLIISGQLPMENGKPKYIGILGDGIGLNDGIAAARLCGLNVLAQASAALGGDLDRITACVRLGVFVAATADYTDHPKVANGASDLMVEILGETGRHARSAVGMAALPFGIPVEIEAEVSIR